MTYRTLMVHLQPRTPHEGLMKIAGNLARRFDAEVIGIAACQPMPAVYSDDYDYGPLMQQNLEAIDQELKSAKAAFDGAFPSGLGWRSSVTTAPIADYLAQEARSSDLFIAGANPKASSFDAWAHVYLPDLVMQIGRPVLIVPISAVQLELDLVTVCWRDTGEARRAVLNALPFLKLATRVAVVEIAAEDELGAARLRLSDVVGWLGRHGVAAEAVATRSTGDERAQLRKLVDEQETDLIVAGAYGHSRLREWALGGVTRDLLLHSERCSLVSH